MNMNTTELGCWSLSGIVEGRYFRVPDYQRGYAWGLRQLEEFWEDLMALMESGGKHYTGAITVKALAGAPEVHSRKGFEVVDGQQRLTTVAILFAAMKDVGSPFVIDESESELVLSYGPQNIDAQFLQNLLTSKEIGQPQNSHQRNLKYAFEFFVGRLADVGSELQTIADALKTRLAFDFRIIGSDYSAGIVFETMNNRGKPLTLLEKLKNRLMYLVDTLTPDDDVDAEDVLEECKVSLRGKIDTSWGMIYQTLASSPTHDPLDEDEFVAAHLSVYRAPKESVYSRTIAESRLFKMFCSTAERHPKSERIDENDKKAVAKAIKERRVEEQVTAEKIRDYVEDLVAFSKSWAKIHYDCDSAVGRCRSLSGTLEVKVFLSSVLLHVADEKVLQTILKSAETILFRNTVRSVLDEASLATLARRLHGKCLDMLKKGDDEQIDPTGVADLLREYVEDEGRQIDIPAFVDFFAGQMNRLQSPYGFYGWKGLKYFLFLQEGENGLGWDQYDESTLEHVMPQSSTADNDDGWWCRQAEQFTTALGYANWEALTNKEKRVCRQWKRKLVNSLGNFVLLTQSENASVSDDPWESYAEVAGVHKAVIGKRAFYLDAGHQSSTGARCVAQTAGSWNAYRIRERGRALIRSLATSLGVSGYLDDENCDLALGFDSVTSLKDTQFPILSDEVVRMLAPRLGTAAEPQKESASVDDAHAAYVSFWNAFKDWCLANGHMWCTAAVAQRGNRYYDPQGGGSCHLFFTIGERSGGVRSTDPLITIGIYCEQGEAQRRQIRMWAEDFDSASAACPFDFQDWESGSASRKAKGIRFVRRADYRNPSPELFARMAQDYEMIRSVMNQHELLS